MQYNPLSKGLADMLITDLSNVESIQIVEREKLQNLISEIKLGDTKYFDPETAQKLGKGLGADIILTGAFLSIEPMMRIDARLIDVGTGKIIQSNKVEGPASEFFKLESKLADLIKKELKIKLDKSFTNKDRSVDFSSIINYSKSIDYSDKGMKREAERILEKTIEENPSFTYASDRLQSIRKYLESIEIKMADAEKQKVQSLIDNLDPDSPQFIADINQIINSLGNKMASFRLFMQQFQNLNFDKDEDRGGYTLNEFILYNKLVIRHNYKEYENVLDLAEQYLKKYKPTSMYYSQTKWLAETALNELDKREKGKSIAAELISDYNELYAHMESLYNPEDYKGSDLECCDSDGKITSGELDIIWRDKYFLDSHGKHFEPNARGADFSKKPLGTLRYEFNFVRPKERLKIYTGIYKVYGQYQDEISIRKDILMKYELDVDEYVGESIKIGQALNSLGLYYELQVFIENIKDEYPIPGWAKYDLIELENNVNIMLQ
jgi:TolB-like protein